MDVIYQILLGLAVFGLGCALMLLVRSQHVFNTRKKLIAAISAANKRETEQLLHQGCDQNVAIAALHTRWALFDTVSYESMVYKFWRDPASMYDLNELLDAQGVREWIEGDVNGHQRDQES